MPPVATCNSDCLGLADCVIVHIQCDYTNHPLGNMKTGEADMAALETTLRTIHDSMPDTDRVAIFT